MGSARAGVELLALVVDAAPAAPPRVDLGRVFMHLTGRELPALSAFPNQVLALTPDGIPGNEATLTAVLAALQAAQRAISKDSAVAINALATAFPDLTADVLNEGVPVYASGMPQTPEITKAAYEVALAMFGSDPVPFDQVVNSSLLPR